MSEEEKKFMSCRRSKKKKLNGQFSFLVGPDSSSSEESSTIEYMKYENAWAFTAIPCRALTILASPYLQALQRL